MKFPLRIFVIENVTFCGNVCQNTHPAVDINVTSNEHRRPQGLTEEVETGQSVGIWGKGSDLAASHVQHPFEQLSAGGGLANCVAEGNRDGIRLIETRSVPERLEMKMRACRVSGVARETREISLHTQNRQNWGRTEI
jgi:hypothetical protein